MSEGNSWPGYRHLFLSNDLGGESDSIRDRQLTLQETCTYEGEDRSKLLRIYHSDSDPATFTANKFAELLGSEKEPVAAEVLNSNRSYCMERDTIGLYNEIKGFKSLGIKDQQGEGIILVTDGLILQDLPGHIYNQFSNPQIIGKKAAPMTGGNFGLGENIPFNYFVHFDFGQGVVRVIE